MPTDYVSHGSQEVVVLPAAQLAGIVLAPRQLAVEADTGKQKVGDGTSHYTALSYLPGGGSASFGGWIYGDGLDGAKIATDGLIELGGLYTDYTIPVGVTVQVPTIYNGVVARTPAIIQCTGTFTIAGTLDLSGFDAVGRHVANNAFTIGAATGDGTTGPGTDNDPYLPTFFAPFASGAGGSGASGPGGAGNTQSGRLRNPSLLLAAFANVGGNSIYPAVLGGASGSGDGTNYGGAGGDPGRWALVIARHIVHTPSNSYNLQGGRGGDGGDDGTGSLGHGNCGSGGGGAGGWWVTISDDLTGAANIAGHGGSPGTPCGTGVAGTAGQDGQGIHYLNRT